MFLYATGPGDHANWATGAPARATSLQKYLTVEGITALLTSLNLTEKFYHKLDKQQIYNQTLVLWGYIDAYSKGLGINT